MNTDMCNGSVGPGGMPSPFAATRAWTGIIAYVREHVEVRSHTLKRVTYENCFTGSDLVDVVLYHIQLESTTFRQKPTREGAHKLSQVIYDFQIIEALPNGGDTFSDSSSKLYRFVTQWDGVGSDMKTEDGMASAHTMGVLRLPVQRSSSPVKNAFSERHNRQSCDSPADLLKPGRRVVQELAKLSLFLRRHHRSSVTGTTPMSTPSSVRRASNSSAATPSAVGNSGAATPLGDVQEHVDVDELTRETALYVLTQIIELPILDGILAVIASATYAKTTAAGVVDTATSVGSAGALKRYKSICSILTDSSAEDEWWSTAMRCLECFKRGYSMFEASLNERTIDKQKIYLFRSMSEEYSGRSQPLWSETFSGVHNEMYRLLMEGKESAVIRAAQICLVLVGDKESEEMKRLLEFLKQAICRESVLLFKSETNAIGIERTFTPVFFKSKLLTSHQLGQMLVFLIENVDKLWGLPDDVVHLVQSRLCSLYDSTAEQATEKTFCQRVTIDEFSRQKADSTEVALVALMNSVFDDTRMPLKDKTVMLENFKLHHGELFRKHFPNIA